MTPTHVPKLTYRRLKAITLAWVLVGTVIAGCQGAKIGDRNAKEDLVRDHVWLWAQVAGAYNDPYLKVLSRKSSIEPLPAAQYMGIRNIVLSTIKGQPAPPFDEYYRQFATMDKVVWSLTGACGATSEVERQAAMDLAQKHPNIAGFVLDDFLCGGALPPPPVNWLAEVFVKFPVTVTLTPPGQVACDKLELTQSAWPEGSYRTKDIAVDISPDGATWEQVATGTTPNEPAGKLAVALPGRKLAALRVRILNTHDTKGGLSCGLKRVRLWEKARPVDTSTWKAQASSAYSTFTPDCLLVDEQALPLPAVLTPQQLSELRARLVIGGRRLPLASVVYTDNISPRAIHHLKYVDWVQLWTWRPPELKNLQQNFERLEKLAPDKRIFLGCYMYDFDTHQPIPMDLMKAQAELGLKWLKAGRIEGIIFIGTPICDVDLEAVEWTRKWVAAVGDQRLPARRR